MSLSFLKKTILESNQIDPALYDTFDVKRGLRNKDGSGVLAGLTKIASVIGVKKEGSETLSVEGKLTYRGISIDELLVQLEKTKGFFFERTCFLLLVGRLPDETEFALFLKEMEGSRSIPEGILDHIIKGIPGKNIMNKLEMMIAALYGYDEDPDSTDPYEELLKSIKILSKLPVLVAYAYLSAYGFQPKFLVPKQGMSIAESFLYVLREGQSVDPAEAYLLDLCLVLHAEHGGGNNSTFAARVVTSSASDIYSALVAGTASLKGPLHGSANKKVMEMMADIKDHVKDWEDKREVRAYLEKIVYQEANDKTGKIYGLGHAVYTKSDPRAVIIKSYAEKMAKSKNREKEMTLYTLVASEGPEVFQRIKKSDKVIAPNVDLFSGFVYDCMGIPEPLYTPLFAMARASGWCAHRLEELVSGKRIIRPGYKFVGAL